MKKIFSVVLAALLVFGSPVYAESETGGDFGGDFDSDVGGDSGGDLDADFDRADAARADFEASPSLDNFVDHQEAKGELLDEIGKEFDKQ